MVLRSPTVAGQTDICDWIEGNIRLAQKAGSGQRTRLYPWQRDIFYAWADPGIREMYLVLPAQMTKTTVGFGSVCFSADAQPSPMMYVTATEDGVTEMRAEKIDPMIDSCPPLRRANRLQGLKSAGKAGRPKERLDNRLIIQFGGGASLMFGWASAERTLVGKSVQRVVSDEIDKYRNWQRVKGNLKDRMEIFIGREKLLAISSPHGSAIMAEYRATDMRRFWMPCVDCGEHQTFEWTNVVIEEIGEDDYTGRLYCPHCGVEIDDRMRRTMIDQGEWRAEHPEIAHRAGFHLNRFYDPNTTIAHICGRYSEKRMAKRMFFNGTLALEYKDDDVAEIGDDKWSVFFRPEPPWEGDPTAITMGVDVQQDRLEYQVVLWYGGDDGFIAGHTSIPFPLTVGPDGVERLDQDAGFARLGEVYREIDPDRTLIDMSYKPQWVQDGIKRHLGFYHAAGRVFACRGRSENSFDMDIVDRPSGSPKFRHYLVATDEAKMTIWDMIDKGHLFCSATNVPEKFRQQLESEKLVGVENSRGEVEMQWQKVSARNEALDCNVYALAAKRALPLDFDRRKLVAAGSRKRYGPAAGGDDA